MSKIQPENLHGELQANQFRLQTVRYVMVIVEIQGKTHQYASPGCSTSLQNVFVLGNSQARDSIFCAEWSYLDFPPNRGL